MVCPIVTTSIFNLYCYKLEQVSSQYILQVAVILLFILVNNEINSKKNKITFVEMKYIFFDRFQQLLIFH